MKLSLQEQLTGLTYSLNIQLNTAFPTAVKYFQHFDISLCTRPKTLNDPIVPDGPRPDTSDRNSAVSFNADASVSVNTYMDAMTNTLAGVHSASRISHDRVAVYFDSRQAALHAAHSIRILIQGLLP